MKISNEDYAHIKACLATVIEHYDEVRSFVEREDIYKNKERAAAFILVRFTYKNTDLLRFICDKVYGYANDDHLYTAYKKAIKELRGAKLHEQAISARIS